MEPYKISIILPCYKVAQYIERCINSILTQDFPNYEVIIINDGSPDNLLQICKQWEGLSNFTILSSHSFFQHVTKFYPTPMQMLLNSALKVQK